MNFEHILRVAETWRSSQYSTAEKEFKEIEWLSQRWKDLKCPNCNKEDISISPFAEVQIDAGGTGYPDKRYNLRCNSCYFEFQKTEPLVHSFQY